MLWRRVTPQEFVIQFVVATFLTVLIWCLQRKAVPIDAMFRRLAISGIGSLEKVTSAVAIAGREQAANNECVRASMRPRPVIGTVGFTDVGRAVEGTASVWERL